MPLATGLVKRNSFPGWHNNFCLGHSVQVALCLIQSPALQILDLCSGQWSGRAWSWQFTLCRL